MSLRNNRFTKVRRDKHYNSLKTSTRNKVPRFPTFPDPKTIAGYPGMEGEIIFNRKAMAFYGHDGVRWVPFGQASTYSPGVNIVYIADVANGGSDANDGLTPATPKFTLPACFEILRESSADQAIVEIVGPSTIDLSSTPTIDITPLEDLYSRIIIRGQRVVLASGTSVAIAQTSADTRDPRFRWATITTPGGLTPGAHVKQFYRDNTVDLVFAIHSNTATDVNLTGGFSGPYNFGFTTGAPDSYEIYDTQAVIIHPTSKITILSKSLPLVLQDLDLQPSVLGMFLGFGVRGASMVLELIGCRYSPPSSFAGPLEFSVSLNGCVAETRGPGTPTGYITRSNRLTTQIIAGSYIDNVTTQPVGAQVRLWGSYFDNIGAFVQFLNSQVNGQACWFNNANDVALSLSIGSTGAFFLCRWDNSGGAGVQVATSSNVLVDDSTFANCAIFTSCESNSSLRMRRNTYITSTGTGIFFTDGSQGTVLDSNITGSGGASILVTDVANISIENTSITSSGSHAIHVNRGGEINTSGVSITASGGDAIRLETGSELHGGSVSGVGAAAAGFHLIHIASKSDAALNVVPTATPTTVGNDYRVGSAGTKTKALVSGGMPADVNDLFSGIVPVEGCSIYTP